MKLRNKLVLAGALVFLASQAMAYQPPSRESISETVTINAEPSKVWALVCDFNGMSRWRPDVENSSVVEDANHMVTRTLLLKGGGREVDSLQPCDSAEQVAQYRVQSSPWRVTDYSSWMKVSPGPEPGTTVVEWHGAFFFKTVNEGAETPPVRSSAESPGGPVVWGLDIETDVDYADKPAKPKYDRNALKEIKRVYRTGLDNLKRVIEQ
jgi:hypothetical protein